MLYVGLDVHSTRSSLCILNASGGIVNRFEVKGRRSAVIDRRSASATRRRAATGTLPVLDERGLPGAGLGFEHELIDQPRYGTERCAATITRSF